MNKWLFIINQWIIPFIPFIVYLFYIGIKGEWNMIGAIWGAVAVVAAALIGLIGTIIATSKKRPKIEDTNKIKNNTLDIKNQIGEDKNRSLIRDHNDIIKTLEKNLVNKDSTILSKLENIDKFVLKENYKKELLGHERDYLKIIELERAQDKLEIKNLEEQREQLLNRLVDYKEIEFENKMLKEKLEEYEKNMGPSR